MIKSSHLQVIGLSEPGWLVISVVWLDGLRLHAFYITRFLHQSC